VVLIGVVVVVHELGHLVIARANGVFCEVFSFGFGPSLASWTDGKGTKWRIALIPLGGYVKMFGDADATSVRAAIPVGYTGADMERMSAHRKKPWQRLVIAAGGPVANFIFAIIVMFFLVFISGIPHYANTIQVGEQDTPAYKAGLRTGDIVVKANDIPITEFAELRTEISKSAGKELKLRVKRGEQVQEVTVKMYDGDGATRKAWSVLGVAPMHIFSERVGILRALAHAAIATYSIARDNIAAVAKMLVGKANVQNLGGIISVFSLTSSSAEQGVAAYVYMIAMISVMLGAINVLPIPVLDGGAIILSCIEWIVGRPLPKKAVETVYLTGMVVVGCLLVLGLWNDLEKCKFFVWVESLFR
jgi:regulator of sigma E protease